ncbi:mitochondrial import receptor subunit TOM40 homolog 1-like [Arctopsyche grandis]
MWSQINDEISSLTRPASKNVPSLQTIMSGAKEALLSPGPILLVNIHRQCKQVYPKHYSGITLLLNKNINDQVKYNFNLNLNPLEPYHSPYNAYVGRELERYSTDQNQAGYSNITLEQSISEELKCSVSGHVQHVNAGTVDCVFDYSGKNFTTSASISNINASKTEVILQHLHEINKKVSIGAELGLQTANITSIDSKRASIVGRYCEDNLGVVSGTLNNRGLQVCLFKKIKPQLKIATVLDVCFETKHLIGSLACQIIEKDVCLRTSVDTDGYVALNLTNNSLYERDNIVVKPNISLLCNSLDPKSVKFGVGFEVFV